MSCQGQEAGKRHIWGRTRSCKSSGPFCGHSRHKIPEHNVCFSQTEVPPILWHPRKSHRPFSCRANPRVHCWRPQSWYAQCDSLWERTKYSAWSVLWWSQRGRVTVRNQQLWHQGTLWQISPETVGLLYINWKTLWNCEFQNINGDPII